MRKLLCFALMFSLGCGEALAQTAISALPNGGLMQQTDTVPMVRGGVTMKALPYAWPANGSVMISSGTSAPLGIPPINGYGLIGSGGSWTTGPVGTGTVTSVTFTGDGTLLSTTPSSPAITTSGTVTATLKNAPAKTLFGNFTGVSNQPVYTTDPVVSGHITASQFFSSIGTGTAPFTVASTTPVSGLSITGNAGTVTTNANMTGDVTSIGNATTVAKIQTTTVSGTTGSGNVAFSISPTFTGTVGASAITSAGLVTGSAFNATAAIAPPQGIYSPGGTAVGITGGSLRQFEVDPTASAVDYWAFTGGATGSPGSVSATATGADTNIGMSFTAKGATGGFLFNTTNGRQAAIFDGGGGTTVNYFNLGGGATGIKPSISSQGEASNGLAIYSSGTGNVEFSTDNTTGSKISIIGGSAKADGISFTGGTTASPGTVTWTANGSDTNVNIKELPKGNAHFETTGLVSTGTKFTTSGCSISATTGGAAAGTYTSGTTGTCTAVITLGGATGLTAPTGWTCWANDLTTPADKQQTTSSNTTTVTIAGTTVSGDVVSFGCMGF